MAVLRLMTSLAWRNLWRNWRRTLILLFAVAIGVWSLVSFAALMQAWSTSTWRTGLMSLTGQGQIHARDYLDNPNTAQSMPPLPQDLKTLLNSKAVARWASRVRVPAVVQSEYRAYPVTLVGIQPAREQGLSFIADAVRQGRYLDGPADTGVLLSQKLAQRLHTGLGKRVVIMSQGAGGKLVERGFPVVGLFVAESQDESGYAFTGFSEAQTMLNMDGRISEVSFDLHDVGDLPDFITRLRNAAPRLDVQPWSKLLPLVKAMTQLSDSFVWIWLAIMFSLLGFGIVNTLLMALFERTRELGLLQALGMRPRLIFTQVMLETLMLVGMGVGIGLVFGAGTIVAFHGGLDLGFLGQGAEWLGAGRILYPRLDTGQFFGTGILIWGLGVVASLWPVWRTVRRIPLDALTRT